MTSRYRLHRDYRWTDRRRPAVTFTCLDCAVDTDEIGEYYMVNDYVWKQTGIAPDGGKLCIGCLETRIGRRLMSSDFPHYPINYAGIFRQSDRLRNRMGMAT